MDMENLRTKSDLTEVMENRSAVRENDLSKLQQENLEKKSSVSVKSKRSSNILSNFLRKTKHRRKISSKSASSLIPNISYIRSASSLGNHTEEEEIDVSADNYEKGEEGRYKSLEDNDYNKCLHLTESDNSVPSTVKTKRQFFKKLLKKHSSHETTKSDDLEGAKQNNKVIPVEDMTKIAFQPADTTKNIPTSYICFGNSTLNPTLETGLQEVKDLTNRLEESESHLIRIFTSFIKDPSLQKDLIEILFQHSKLQWETERRTSALSNDMWLHQIEIGRTQDHVLQDTLSSLVKQNRQLQIENEVLFRKHEKILRKLKNMSDATSNNKCIDCDLQLGKILKHNEELQFKLEAYHREIESLEEELHMLQKHNENVEKHLRHSTSHVQNLKAMFARSKVGYELEIVSLNKDLQRNEQVIKDCIEAGALLLEDFERAKKQLQKLPLAISWTKSNCKGTEMADLLRFSRFVINEFSKEIISLHSELCLKVEDFKKLQLEKLKLEEIRQKTLLEIEAFSSDKNEEMTAKLQTDPQNPQLEVLQGELDKVNQTFNSEKSSLLKTIAEYQRLDAEVLEKNKLIEQTKQFISNMTSENIALRGQLDGLNKLLNETGAGDMVKELSISQDQLYFYKSQYYQLLNEKQILIDKQTLLEKERTEILTREESNYGLFQKQISELKHLQKEYKILHQQYEKEHQTVMSLQNERMKYLEEKSMLKAIFNHMKTEFSRIQKLEGTVIDISKEANKLALVAEYNQKLGCKLKNVLKEKDQTIVQLKSSVEKLNDIQLQQTKEKLSLCYELSEICQIKEHLSEILTVEVQKNYALDDSKRQIVHTATSQVRKLEETQKNDRSALKNVIKDLKSVVSLKNDLQRDNDKQKEEIAILKTAVNEYKRNTDSLISAKKEQESIILNLKTSNNVDKEMLKNVEEKLEHETEKYNSDLSQLKNLIIQLRREKEELDNSVKYLQNNSKKPHQDLNDVRKREKELQDQLKKIMIEKQEIELESITVKKNLEETINEKEKLVAEIHHLNSLCEKMLHSMETTMQASVEKEELFKQELDDSRNLIMTLTKDVESMRTIIKEKETKLSHLDSECSMLKEKEELYCDATNSKKTLEKENADLKIKSNTLENELNELQNEYISLKTLFDQTQEALILLQTQLKALYQQRENDHHVYLQKLEEANRKSLDLQEEISLENNSLKLQINDLSERLENEKNSYGSLSEIHKELSENFAKTLKDNAYERNARREAVKNLKNLEENIQNLVSEKGELQNQVTMLLDAMEDSKNRINSLSTEKETLQRNMDDLHKRYNEVLKKCLSLENQILGAEIQNDDTECEKMRQHISQLNKETQENQNIITNLRNEVANLEHELTTCEFQKSELTLRLHEIQRKLETEQNLCQQMQNTHRLVLATVLQMRDDRKLDCADCNTLIHMVQNSGSTSSDEY